MSQVVPAAAGSTGWGDLLAAYSQSTEGTRRSLDARLSHAPAGDILREYVARGKMLRASLVFAASASVGGRPEDVVMGAEAIELMHAASLFHDDIIDHAAQRRGIASLHERLGVGPALVVGDELLLRALSVLGEARACHSAARVLQAINALTDLARECCHGQFDELQASRGISEAEYLAIVTRKTASPFVAAGTLGVLLGGGTDAHLDQLRIYSRQLGIAFQIADDLLDLIGEPAAMGKPVGNSLAQGRPMLPLIYLLQVGTDVEKQELSSIGEGGPTRDRLVALLDHYGIVERVRQVQQRHLDTAVDALTGLPGAVGVEALRALVARASARPVDNLGAS
jgi:octaprenyl-diphosphate synthase